MTRITVVLTARVGVLFPCLSSGTVVNILTKSHNMIMVRDVPEGMLESDDMVVAPVILSMAAKLLPCSLARLRE